MKFTASGISFAAEILESCGVAGENNSEGARCYSLFPAVSGAKQQQNAKERTRAAQEGCDAFPLCAIADALHGSSLTCLINFPAPAARAAFLTPVRSKFRPRPGPFVRNSGEIRRRPRPFTSR
jgi:hypothetical protein